MSERYERLHAIVEELNSSPLVRTKEWYAEHNHLLRVYERHFETFTGVQPEITDANFRANCRLLDTLMTKLLKNYDSHEWFSLFDYLQFNETLISVADFVLTLEKDDLDSLFSNMRV